MKQISWLVSLLVLAIVFPGCREDEPAKPGNIRFALNPTVITDGQGRQATSLPGGASLYVSIRRVSGDEVYTLEPIRLLRIGEAYISEPLALPGGNYELTDFLVADGADNIVYATPREGSELAPWVDDPLPQVFAVSDNAIAQVDVQVLPVEARLPEQFGYVTFRIDVVPFPYFQLAVFRADSTQPRFSPAHVYLLSEGDTVYRRHLPAGIQPISFPGNPEATYTLVVQEDALTTYRQTFVLRELVTELNGVPLRVTLQPALTFTALYRFDFYQFWIALNETTPEGSFTIDWGDGIVEEYDATGGYAQFEHHYPGIGDYHVSLSGDLNIVRHVALVFGFGASDNIFLHALPNLRSFAEGTGFDFGPDSLDFSHNPKLEDITLEYSTVRYFDVSNNPRLISLHLLASDEIPTSVIDKVIADVHRHAFELTLERGYFNIYTGVGEGTFIGPPSPEAIELFRDLKNLGWNLTPDPN
jgi:hypothetical protein